MNAQETGAFVARNRGAGQGEVRGEGECRDGGDEDSQHGITLRGP